MGGVLIEEGDEAADASCLSVMEGDNERVGVIDGERGEWGE